MKLMIVDDSTIIRNRIARLSTHALLSDWQITIVGQACNGREAIDLFIKTRPNIVTMDLTMPEMDGVECTQRLTSIAPEIKILVISALSDKTTALKALKNGACGFLYKPFNDEQFITAIETLVS